jgi:hypothetical protein
MPKLLFTTSVRFNASQCAWLTSIASKILERHGKHIDRSALLRGLVDGFASARIDLSTCSTEAEVKRAVARHFGPLAGRRSGRRPTASRVADGVDE